MKAEDFAAWLAGIWGMSSAQRAEDFATLEEKGGGRGRRDGGGLQGKGRASWGVGRTRLERRVLSGSRLRGVRTAPAARSLAGVARTGCCGSAARVAGAPSTG